MAGAYGTAGNLKSLNNDPEAVELTLRGKPRVILTVEQSSMLSLLTDFRKRHMPRGLKPALFNCSSAAIQNMTCPENTEAYESGV